MSIRSISCFGLARFGLARNALREVGKWTLRTRTQQVLKRALAHKATCPPLVKHDADGKTAVDRTHHKSLQPQNDTTEIAIWPQHTQPKPERVKFWTEEASKSKHEDGHLCLSSHPLGDSMTEEDQYAVLEAILHGKIHTLGLPKEVSVSQIEHLLRATAFLNRGILPAFDCFRRDKVPPESVTYDLARQTFDIKDLIEELSQRKDLSFLTIYNIPLSGENIGLLSQFIKDHAEPLAFFLNVAPSNTHDLLYNSLEMTLSIAPVEAEY